MQYTQKIIFIFIAIACITNQAMEYNGYTIIDNSHLDCKKADDLSVSLEEAEQMRLSIKRNKTDIQAIVEYVPFAQSEALVLNFIKRSLFASKANQSNMQSIMKWIAIWQRLSSKTGTEADKNALIAFIEKVVNEPST